MPPITVWCRGVSTGRTGILRTARRWAAAAVLSLLTFGSGVTAGAATSSAATGGPLSGPDVSSWNHPNGSCIDWAHVARGDTKYAAPPRQFAFIKATEGSTYTNPYLASCAGAAAKGDWAATAAAGLVRGAYHYARPGTPVAANAIAQADFFVATIGDQHQPGTLAPALDMEESGGLSPADLVTWTQIWLDRVRQATGRVPIIYTYPYFWANQMAGSPAFHAYPVWMADYRAGGPSLPLQGAWPNWTFWQFTSVAQQPGIGGNVDMSEFSADQAALTTLADGTAPMQWTPVAPSAPQKVTASAGNGTATVSWVPNDNGGSLVTSYVITSSDGTQVTVSGQTTRTVVSGLANGTSYSFRVSAVSVVGTSPTSSKSQTVLPQVPTQIASAISSTDVAYGTGVTFSATLVRTDTNAPLAGQTLAVWQRPAGTTAWAQVGTAVTNAEGTAIWAFRPPQATETRMIWTPPTMEFVGQTTFVRTVTVHDVPTALNLALSQSLVRAGAPTKVTALLRRADTRTPISRATVAVYTRPHGTTPWTYAGTVTTSVNGTTSWAFAPTRNADVKFSWTAPAHWTSPASAVTASVLPIVAARLAAPTATVRHGVTLSGAVAPAMAGRTVYVQRLVNGTWTNIASTKLTSTSRFAIAVSGTRKGSYVYRVWLPASSAYAQSVSASVTLVVK
jgi:lysozyme